MLQKRFVKIIFFIIISAIFSGIAVSACFAQTPAKLKVFKLQGVKSDLKIIIEHSKQPLDVNIEKSLDPLLLRIKLIGSEIAFQEYKNIPIEIPINKYGVSKIIIEQKNNLLRKPPTDVFITVEMNQDFTYLTDSQWNGQYLNIVVHPSGKPIEKQKLAGSLSSLQPSKKMRIIQKRKTQDAQAARKKLEEFSQKKQIDLIGKESESRVSKVREQANQRINSTEELEKAYKKMKAESDISTIPEARARIAEQNLYKDISMPSEVKPIIQRVTLSEKVSSLEECLNLAMAKSLPVQIAKEQELLSKLRVREARRAFYPSFLAEWNETDGNTVSEPYRGRSYGLQAEQPLFSGGKLTATLRKEQLGEIIARGNLDRVKQDVIMQINKTYFEFVGVKNTLDIMKRLKVRVKELLDQLEKEFAIESATSSDFLTAQSFYNQVCFQVASYERELALAKIALEKELSVEELDVSELSYHIRRRSINTNLNECLDLAFKNRPEILILERTLEAAKYSNDIIKSEEMPNVSLQGSYGRSGEAFSQRDLNLATEWSLIGKVRWFLGGNTVESSYKKEKVTPYRVTKTDTNIDSQTFNTKFSFWDNLAHFTKKKEAQITRKQALKDLEEQRNKIRQETEDAYYSYLKYKTQLSLAINEIGFRRKQLEISQAKRSMNESNATEVMDAEIKLAQSNATMQEALGGINISIANLNRAIGITNYFHEL